MVKRMNVRQATQEMKKTINNSVTQHYEKGRASPFLVRWFGSPDPTTGAQVRYSKAFKSRQQAKAFFAEKQAEFYRGAPRDPVNVTLGELVEEFRQTRLVGLSHATCISYEHTIKELIGYFGRLKLIREIQRRHAEAFIASRKRCDGRKGELSSWSKARHVINCRALLGSAVSWDYIAENPFRAAQGMASALRQNAKAKSTWHYLTPEEFDRFIAIVPTSRLRAMYWLMFSCGLRFGEAANIRLATLDLTNKRVHVVNRAGTEDIPPFTVKAERQSSSSKERSIPIPEAALIDLTEAMKGAFRAGGFIVLSSERYELVREHWRLCREGQPWGGHDWRPWQNRDLVINVLRDTKRYLRWAKIELNGSFNLHTFRKSYAQSLANAGVPPRTLAQLLGHSDPKMALRYYARVCDSNEKAAADVMNGLLSRNTSPAQERKQGS